MPLLGTRGAASAKGFGLTASTKAVPTVIGQPFGGGYFAGLISTAGNGVADYYLIVAPNSSGYAVDVKWANASGTTGATSVINGNTNSTTLNSPSYPAAYFCKGLTIGGYSDWYLPARNELEICYYNLKPDTTSNSTTSGADTNAVPSRASNYTAGNPAQTSASAFQIYNGEDFDISGYWSSTEAASTTARYQTFDNGNQTSSGKTALFRVRAVRRVPV